MIKCSLLVILSLIFVSCSNSDDASSSRPTNPVAVPLEPAVFNGDCLNLKALASHLNQPGFTVPSLSYTRNFVIHNGSSSAAVEKSLYASHYSYSKTPMRGYREFQNAEQTGCETVSLPLTGTVMGQYKITESTSRSLKLELIPFTQPMIPGRPEGKRFVDTIQSFYIPTALEISVVNPRRILITSTHPLVPNVCRSGDAKITVTESRSLQWDENEANLPSTLELAQSFQSKIEALFPPAAPTPAPPTESAEPAERNEFVEVSLATIEQFNQSFAAMEPPCVF